MSEHSTISTSLVRVERHPVRKDVFQGALGELGEFRETGIALKMNEPGFGLICPKNGYQLGAW
jgi:hypothetical protein